MDYFSLTRSFWDFAFSNPDKIKTNHIALYLYAVERCNRLTWKDKFGLPTSMTMEYVQIRSYNTYIKTFNDLVDLGLFILHEKSTNQYTANVISLTNFALSKNDKAHDKAPSKHDTKHCIKQVESTVQSIDSIDKQLKHIDSKDIKNNKTEFLKNLFPKFNENFARKWNTWLSHLNEKGKSPTIGQMQEQISFLNEYNQHLAEQIISTSLNGGYTALYKPKDTQVANGIGKRPDGLKKTR